jgi:hypothetical protein
MPLLDFVPRQNCEDVVLIGTYSVIRHAKKEVLAFWNIISYSEPYWHIIFIPVCLFTNYTWIIFISVCLFTNYTWSTGWFLRISCYWTPSEIGTVWRSFDKQFNQRGDRAKYFLKIVSGALLHMRLVLWTCLPVICVVLRCNFWSSIPENPKRTTQHRLYLTSPRIINSVCGNHVHKPED